MSNIDTPMTNKIHQGRNVKGFREMLGLKQEAFADSLGEGWTQRRVSLLEGKEEIEEEVLEQVAEVLRVPVEAIKNFDEEKAINVISNTTFENCQQPAVINYSPTFNPIDKIVELYERMLQLEREKNELLERIIKGS